MSSDHSDDKPARKTLSLNKSGDSPAPASDKSRKRSGARARAAAVASIENAKAGRLKAALAPAAPLGEPIRERSSRSAVRAPERRPVAQTQDQGRHTVDPRARHVALFASCPRGMELALKAELQALGFDEVRVGRAGCHFQSPDWLGVQRANLYSRLATRILAKLDRRPVRTEDELYSFARDVAWEQWFGPEHRLRVDTSAVHSPMQSLQFCNLRVKDGICDRLRDREGARPDIDTVRPDVRVHVFLDETSATLYLDTSGESLFKRGWRLDKGEAPLRENLAAGLLALSGWDPDAPLLDPFCGSATLLIEAAWIALGVPPGISRPFAFERLRDHDDRDWADLKDDALSRIQPQLDTPIFGCDINPEAIEHARRNIERAGLAPDLIRLEVADAMQFPAPADHGWIVTNPPYGERMDVQAQAETPWRDWSAWLKRQYGGWQLHVITSDMKLPEQLRLKPLRRTPVYNGALDCRLFSFELVSAGYRDADRAAVDEPEPDAPADDTHTD